MSDQIPFKSGGLLNRLFLQLSTPTLNIIVKVASYHLHPKCLLSSLKGSCAGLTTIKIKIPARSSACAWERSSCCKFINEAVNRYLENAKAQFCKNYFFVLQTDGCTFKYGFMALSWRRQIF